MGTLYVFVIIVTLSTHCSAYVMSHSETDRSIASVILKEGQTAEISCMTKGTGDFFWRKGENLYNSTLVASFTVGEVSDDSQPYSVTANGTLYIRSVTLKDEGNYFCRVSSTENECYGEVKILVQASLLHFDLAIDRCGGESSCLLYLDPSQSTSLTCTALNAPHLMTLKWFNGSKEITDGIEQIEILPPNGNSREITSTVAAVYGHPASLTCQAVDPKRSNDDVRFAHAQVEMTVPVKGTLPSWIIVAVTLAGCFIFFGIAFLIKAMVNRKQRKKYKNLSSQRYTSLQGEKDEAISQLKAEKDEVISQLKAEKDEVISQLKGKLRQTEEELEKIRNDNIELQTRTAKDEAKITYAEESAKTKNKERANTDQELTDLKTKLQQRGEDIEKAKNENLELQKTIANNEATLTAAKEIAKSKDQEIANKDQELTDLKTKLKQRDEDNLELQKKIANNKAKIIATEELARTKDQELANKDQELTDLKSKLPDQIQEMSTLKGDLESKAKSLAELEVKLKQQEEEINKERNANINLQETIASAKGETTVAADLAERRNKEISQLKETVKQKDKEINNQREQFLDCQTNLLREHTISQGKSDDISKLKGKLTEKDDELVKIRKELDKLKDTLRRKEEDIKREKNENANLQEKTDIERKNDKIYELKGNLTQKDDALREITIKLEKSKAIVKDKSVELLNTSKKLADLKEKFTRLEELYNNLKGAQQRSQTKPRKKHQGNDGD